MRLLGCGLCLHHSRSVQHYRETFLVRGLYKLEFKTCLNSKSAWRLALDNVEQSQSSCVIVSLGQERHAEKLIVYILLQVSISYMPLETPCAFDVYQLLSYTLHWLSQAFSSPISKLTEIV